MKKPYYRESSRCSLLPQFREKFLEGWRGCNLKEVSGVVEISFVSEIRFSKGEREFEF